MSVAHDMSAEHSEAFRDDLDYQRPEVLDEICARLMVGEPLAQICRDPRMPNVAMVYHWSRAAPLVDERIARARDFGADHIALDALNIADDLSGDVQRDKLRIETRLKLLAKWNPKKYGDNMQLRHADADGEKLNTQPLVSELLTMLGPGATLQAAVKLEAPAHNPAAAERLPSAFGQPLLEARRAALDAEADVMLQRSEAKVARRAAARAEVKDGYRPRGMARPASDVDDLV